MEADLHRAVKRGELCLHYQSIVFLASGRMEGVEALGCAPDLLPIRMQAMLEIRRFGP